MIFKGQKGKLTKNTNVAPTNDTNCSIALLVKISVLPVFSSSENVILPNMCHTFPGTYLLMIVNNQALIDLTTEISFDFLIEIFFKIIDQLKENVIKYRDEKTIDHKNDVKDISQWYFFIDSNCLYKKYIQNKNGIKTPIIRNNFFLRNLFFK